MLPTPHPITDLILETFRLNGELLASGDRLVLDVGLTAARWQVLGAIDLSPVPLPVAHIARNMGLSRQAVQRLANELGALGLVRFVANPYHARAKLIVMTERGRKAYDAAMARQRPWAKTIASGVSVKDLGTALRVLRHLRGNLELSHSATQEADHVDEEHR
jgi:DNA-binding MarR family transcriptional regulator